MAAVQIQRPLRGSRISTFYPVKRENLPPLSSLDSAFQLQEYISLLIRLDVHDVESIVSIPGKGSKSKDAGSAEAKEGAGAAEAEDKKEKEVTVDEACWKYEQLRRLAQDLSHPLITMLQQVCTRSTCPEMKAGEWLYLCVAHGNDGAMEQCCAIDYILHTLDSATALLNSPRAFPSRLQIPPASHRHFTSLARRLGRIFAHAYFHHREEFEQAEAESSLYARFLALTEKFDLVPADFLVIPPRVAASSSIESVVGAPSVDVPPPTLGGAALQVDTNAAAADAVDSAPNSAVPAGASAAASSSSPSGGNSPPGLDDAANASPRRYGRSRTDTMMLEGEGRFPASPLATPEDGPAPVGLEAVLALAEAEARKEAEEEEAAAAAVAAATQLTAEPDSTTEDNDHTDDGQELEHENDTTAEEAHAQIAMGLPESPTSAADIRTGLAPEPPSPQGDEMPVITPSSSTSGPKPKPGDIEVVQGEGSDGEEDAGEGEKTGPTVDAGMAVPELVVEPATPLPSEEKQQEEEKAPEVEVEQPVAVGVDEVPAVDAEAVKEEEAAAPALAPAAEEVAAPEAEAEKKADSEA
ncbi:hypothetical protein MKEN_00717400 [Mycena kentingensis (nom. inval.)]|nr:hypothetical protein MKEN_00717400 [Mycena kentingensis (nom. inval.)]